MRRRSREVLDQLESHQKLGIVMLGRAYHHDPGLNHEIMEQFQKLGYPVFSQRPCRWMRTCWSVCSVVKYVRV